LKRLNKKCLRLQCIGSIVLSKAVMCFRFYSTEEHQVNLDYLLYFVDLLYFLSGKEKNK